MGIDYFTYSLIIDDIVLPDGRTLMGQLGGGGPQTAFGMKLWATGGVGLCAGVGADLPAAAERQLAELGIDLAGLRRHPSLPTLRAWQVMEWDGRRTQVWRTQHSAIAEQLTLTPERVPPAYRDARGFHLGVHPEHPNLALAQALAAQGVTVSIEPFRPAERVLSDGEVRALAATGEVFSPTVEEAESIIGPGEPEALVRRLANAGATLVALRMGAEGSLLYHAFTNDLCHVPAVRVMVVDPVGAGNAYCGGLLVGWVETRNLRTAGQFGAVAASFLVEQFGLPQASPRLHEEARRRLEELK